MRQLPASDTPRTDEYWGDKGHDKSVTFLVIKLAPNATASSNPTRRNGRVELMRRDETRRGEARGGGGGGGAGLTWFQTEPTGGGFPFPLAAVSSLRGTGSGAASPVASRTQYLYDDAFSAVAATAAVSSISTRSPAPTTEGRTDGLVPTTPQISRRGEARGGNGMGLDRSTRRVHSNSDRFLGARSSLSLFCLRVSPLRPVWCGLWMRARVLQMLREPSRQLHYTLTEPSSSEQRGLAYQSTVHGWPTRQTHNTLVSFGRVDNERHASKMFFLSHKKRNVKLCPLDPLAPLPLHAHLKLYQFQPFDSILLWIDSIDRWIYWTIGSIDVDNVEASIDKREWI
jgi:hypothetical protein